jgi:glycosyltransferase involved in cell wall biosynthesis
MEYKTPTVSIIVPVFNTGSYLRPCLDSILGQSLRDIEVICINDGSSDGSMETLVEYAEKDNRLKIINFPVNRGVSVARNAGIDKANGTYIGFVDGDDTVDKDFFSRLVSVAETSGADIVKGVHLNHDLAGNRYYQLGVFDLNDKIRDNKAWFFFSFYSAIYKKELINVHRIRFPEGLAHFEDPVFSVAAALYCDKVEIVDNAYYFYTERPDSMMRKGFTKRHVTDMRKAADRILDILEMGHADKEHRGIIISFLFKEFVKWAEKPFIPDAITIEAVSGINDLSSRCSDSHQCLVDFFLSRKHFVMRQTINAIRNK